MTAARNIVPPRDVYIPQRMTFAIAVKERASALALIQRLALMDGPAGVACREHLARVKGERS